MAHRSFPQLTPRTIPNVGLPLIARREMNPQPPAQFQQLVPIEPVPVVVAHATSPGPDGSGVVMLQIHSPMGVHCAVLPAQMVIDSLIPQLEQAARTARTGLTIPNSW